MKARSLLALLGISISVLSAGIHADDVGFADSNVVIRTELENNRIYFSLEGSAEYTLPNNSFNVGELDRYLQGHYFSEQDQPMRADMHLMLSESFMINHPSNSFIRKLKSVLEKFNERERMVD